MQRSAKTQCIPIGPGKTSKFGGEEILYTAQKRPLASWNYISLRHFLPLKRSLPPTFFSFFFLFRLLTKCQSEQTTLNAGGRKFQHNLFWPSFLLLLLLLSSWPLSVWFSVCTLLACTHTHTAYVDPLSLVDPGMQPSSSFLLPCLALSASSFTLASGQYVVDLAACAHYAISLFLRIPLCCRRR